MVILLIFVIYNDFYSYILSRQQTRIWRHHTRLMFKQKYYLQLFLIILIVSTVFLSGCGLLSPSKKSKTAILLTTKNATTAELIAKINHLAQVNSMRAKMDLKFEDNSYAEMGIAEKYKSADSEVVVQRPANIFLKVSVPIIKTDVAQMSSNGEKFCVAVLTDGTSDGKYKKFVCGTNSADYSKLQESVNTMDFESSNGNGKAFKENVNAFSNLRPQHFTEALLVRPTDTDHLYVQTEIFQDEADGSQNKKSPLARVIRGYYILDEMTKNDDGSLKVTRRFWFDRVGNIRLARQQIFDVQNTIESDIIYGNEGDLSDDAQFKGLPLRIEVTRPKEKYKISLTYQSPSSVSLGKTYNNDVFLLKNTWKLPEVDLDKTTAGSQQSAIGK